MTHPDCEGCRKALQWAVDLIAQAMADEDSSLDAFDSEQFLKEAKNLGFDYRKPSPAPAKPCAEVTLTDAEIRKTAEEVAESWWFRPRTEVTFELCTEAIYKVLVRRLMGQGEKE
jgi:hypothetical protein